MPDICIFYSEPDRKKVESLASILTDMGWTVWWDKKIKSGDWPFEIEKNIKTSRCVIPIWNSHAARENSITFAEAQKSKDLHIPMVTLVSENIELPLPFNTAHITADIGEWDCNSGADCISKVIESLESVLGIAPIKWKGERPAKINLLGKQVKLPCFVKSLSSHETQLDPEAGLTVLGLFPEADALLVSAYDMYLNDNTSNKEQKEQHEFMCQMLKEQHERGALIILDSGNYEKSRKDDDTWKVENFNWVLANVPYTYAFCFDNLAPSKNPIENAEDVISRVSGEFEDVLIPILHAPKSENGSRNHNLLPEIFYAYASRKQSPFIAVPERELGEGICEKVKTVSKIRHTLNRLGFYQPIHILGTGNPLSILILAAAGADLFDGLEWCRTVVDRETGFLFHHQQFDFFQTQSSDMARYEIVRSAMKEPDVALNLKMGLHNLDFFYEWMEELQEKIKSNNVSAMITYRANFSTRNFINEIEKLMPGLFN